MTSKGKQKLAAINKRYEDYWKTALQDKKTPSFLKIAALLQEFDIDLIQKLNKQLFDHLLSDDNKQVLISNADFSRYSKKYTLNIHKRQEVINELDQKSEFQPLLDKIHPAGKSTLSTFFHKVIHDEPIDLETLDLKELYVLQNALNYLEGTSYSEKLPNLLKIKALIQQQQLYASFRKQTVNFAGREEELKMLINYVDNSSKDKDKNKDPLLIQGIGGIGKSTLIAKFITNLWGKQQQQKIPFIYLDFDKISVNNHKNEPFNPLILAEVAFKQLAIQFPTTEEYQDNPILDIKDTIKHYIIDPASLKMGAVTKSRRRSSSYSRENLYDAIFNRHVKKHHVDYFDNNIPYVLVVLDSFEEFQNKATSTEFYELLNFIEEVKELISPLVFVIAGRTDYFSESFKYEPFHLGPFDQKAAIGYLKNIGITNVDQQRRIANKAEGLPLCLSLLANLVVHQQKELDNNPDPNFNWEKFYEELDQAQLVEQLVIRIIEHIAEDVRKLAIPGIILRKVTPKIIKEVLAIPCELDVPDDDKAFALFNILSKEFALLEKFENTLYFRRDLRQSMQKMIQQKYGAELIEQIHHSALAFYTDKNHPSDRAEYLYHRLMRGDGTTVIDQYYTKDLRPYIEPSLWEFSEKDQIHLYSKMGKRMNMEELKKAPQKEWELYLLSRIKEVFENKGENSLKEVVKLLQQREKRIDNSSLLAWEAKIYERLTKFDKVESIFDQSQDQGFTPSIKITLALAKKHELAFDFQKAINILQPYEKTLHKLNNFEDFTAWSFTYLRLSKRVACDGKQVLKTLEFIKQAYSTFDQNQNPLLNSDEKIWETEVKNTIPTPYDQVTINEQKEWLTAFAKSSGFIKYLRRFYRNFLERKEFLLLFDQINVRFPIKEDEKQARKKMSLFLDNHFQLFLEEISEPGDLKIVTHEFACFLETSNMEGFDRNFALKLDQKSTNTPVEGDTNYITTTEDDIISGDKNTSVNYESSEIPKEEVQNLASLKEKVKEKIVRGRTKDAIDLLDEYVSNSPLEEEYINQILLLSSRMHSLQKNERMGLISTQEGNISRNRINMAVLNFLNDLE